MGTIPLTDGANAPISVKALGELALRVKDLDTMKAFYRDVVGLPIWQDLPGIVFLEVAQAEVGHPQLLALIEREAGEGTRTNLDHFAFLIDLADHDAQKARLESLGIGVFQTTFPLSKFRAIFIADPEGNTLEFVSHDPSV